MIYLLALAEIGENDKKRLKSDTLGSDIRSRIEKFMVQALLFTWTYNHVHNISDILIVEQTFFSPQVKRRMIISNKHGIYELPHKLPNNLRLRILGNKEISGKS